MSLGTAGHELRQAIAACRAGFTWAAAFGLCINLLLLTVPLYTMQLFDHVLSSRSPETLFVLFAIAVGALLAMGGLEAVRRILLGRIGTWLDARLSGPLLAQAIADGRQGEQAANVQGLRDLATLRNFLSGPTIFPIMDAPWTPVFIAAIFVLHPALGVLSVAGTAILFGLAVFGELATRDLLMRSGGAALGALAEAEAAVRNADAVHAMGMRPNLIRRWYKRHGAAAALQGRAADRMSALTAATRFVRLALQIGIMSAGAWLVLRDELTGGGMMAGSILLARALAPVEQAIGSWKGLIVAREAYRRIAAALDRDASPVGRMKLPAPSGPVTIENLVFAYPGMRQPLIGRLDLRIAPGEVLGVVGPTAAGKTTLARLLVGNLRPSAGHVRLGGMDVFHADHDRIGRHIGYLAQDIELFGGTVRENIARMDEGDAVAVVEAARLTGVHGMILAMHAGYDTEIGPGGAALSGGQRQRIGLARALYGSPRLVVLDEPNANLDPDGEKALQGAILTLKRRGATVVVIVHRPQVLQYVDSILFLSGGAARLHGPRDEIMRKLRNPAAAPPPSQRRVDYPSRRPVTPLAEKADEV